MGNQPSCEHIPVMLNPALELLGCRADGQYVDGTVGGGGYAEAILARTAPSGTLIALDWDSEAIARVRAKLHTYGDRLFLQKASFADLPLVLQRLGIGRVDGIVVDLGVSSFHLNDPARGFSFIQDGPLDMRMDQELPQTAADLVNSLDERKLADLIFALGEERWSRRIARVIVSHRRSNPFSSTLELAEAVSLAVPKTRDSLRIHPATRTFQALRMAVNRELETLKTFFSRALDCLKPEGRLCVVAFHSLEDRMVKQEFKNWAKGCRCPSSEIVCRCEGHPLVNLLTKKPLRPHLDEIERNPRARSARLRAVEKLR